MTPPFPKTLPEGYKYLEESVAFDPKRHLALSLPKEKLTLSDLGYTETEIADCPTDFAVSSPARVLSEEGVEVLQQVTRNLRQFAVGCERIKNLVRGGAYQSRFLRDLCLCPEVTEFLSEIYGVAVVPHTMPLHLGHLNFAPDDISEAVDKWHHDTIGLDYVMPVSDPKQLDGGEFQYFRGTKAQAADFANQGEALPDDRIVSPEFPGPGYVVVLHGSMVVHRAAKLNQPGERITMVNAYVPMDTSKPDPCRFHDLTAFDPNHVLFSEWARHKAWLAQGKLATLMDELPFTEDRDQVIHALRVSIADVEDAIQDLSEESDGKMIHYGG
ncbi:MAG: hypothetical protein AAF438_08965 [Pseudomonadota bacterium]